MLSVLAFRLMSDPEKIPEPTLRFFFRLMVDFDLRTAKLLPLPRLVELYGGDLTSAARHISILTRTGLLDRDLSSHPGASASAHAAAPGLDLYCLGTGVTLSKSDIRQWGRESELQESLRRLEPIKARPRAVSPVEP